MKEPGAISSELRTRFGAAVTDGWRDGGFEVAIVAPEAIFDIAVFLKTEKGFDALMDLTAVDYLGANELKRDARFEVVYYFFSFRTLARLRIKVPVSDASPKVASLVSLYASANWLEREVWDLFGIRFVGHGDLRRLLTYDGFEGHPLRKDYPVNRQQPRVEQDFAGVPPFGGRPAALKEEE